MAIPHSTCSRCGSSTPISSCYVCADDDVEAPDAMDAYREWRDYQDHLAEIESYISEHD